MAEHAAEDGTAPGTGVTGTLLTFGHGTTGQERIVELLRARLDDDGLLVYDRGQPGLWE